VCDPYNSVKNTLCSGEPLKFVELRESLQKKWNVSIWEISSNIKVLATEF
jgi:hypothetical protein